MKRVKCCFLLLLCMLALEGCKEDKYVYPSVLTEFINIRTDYSGTLKELITDQGETLSVQQREGLSGLTPDSIYRTVSVYERLESSEEDDAYLYSSQLILAALPLPADQFETVRTDPLSIQSIWKSGEYINLVLLPMVKDKPHAFHFIDQGITEANGKRTLNLTLYHDRNNDMEAFTRKVYLSIPLWGYKEVLEKGDQVVVQINTYEEGMTTRSFTY